MMAPGHIVYKVEYIKDVLYFAIARHDKVLINTNDTHYFSIDHELIYENYYSDFGPLNLGCVYKYCTELNEKLKHLLNKQKIVHYTSEDPRKNANAAFLMGCFGVIYLSLPPKDALRPLISHGQAYRPFQDATQGQSMYTITILDCLQAIKKARELGFFNFQDFDCAEFDKYGKIQGGDLNWIIPDKFLAFIGPVDCSISQFSFYHNPQKYIEYFLQNNIRLVIRLNKRFYDGNVFRNKGISHLDLFFPDGSCPPRHILFKFLQISEEVDCAIAVHCKAGLGRTGSLIGAYLMKHYRMTALEAISWMRICRPGSVIGHQQDWLQKLEPWLIKQGNLYRKRVYQNADELPAHPYGVYSIAKKASLQRPTIHRNKSPSPPPPYHSGVKSYIEHPVRPQASKVREAYDNKAENYRAERRTSPSRNSFTSRNLSNKGDEKTFSRSKTSPTGAGDPRLPSPSQTSRSSAKSNVSNNKNLSGFQPMPPFHVLHTPIIRNINDAKNFLLRPYTFGAEKRKESTTPARIVTHYSSKPSNLSETLPTVVRKPPSQISTTNATATGTGARRQPSPMHSHRLGRSPSPSPTRSMSPVIRTTTIPPPPTPHTNSSFNNHRGRDKIISSRSTLPSLGAASLGARRTSPDALVTPSVRSDERPLATQGDMLNSIKLQRRLKESMQSDRFCALYNKDKSSGPIKQQHSPSRYVKPASPPSQTRTVRKPSTMDRTNSR